MSDRSDAAPGLVAATALLSTGVRLHYYFAGSGDEVVVLLHGWPQTAWQWRHVVPLLAEAGYRVIAPDARGAGHSSRPTRDEGNPGDPRGAGLPRTGYDKRAVAADVHALLTEELGVTGPVTVVGHDIGAMTAVAYALAYRDHVRALVLGEAPVPGTDVYDQLKTSPAMYHFAFHTVLDLPEALVGGREDVYLQHFFDRLGYRPETVDVDHYVRAYSQAGALRAGFGLYRAFEQDAADNRESLQRDGRLTMPVLAFFGEISRFADVTGPMARELATDVRTVEIAESGHWMAEENPRGLASAVTRFLGDVQGSHPATRG